LLAAQQCRPVLEHGRVWWTVSSPRPERARPA